MNVRVARMAKENDGLVTWTGLRAAGLTEREARRAVTKLRRIHDGVFLTGHGRLTDHQRRLAATLTTPDSTLTHASAGGLHPFRPGPRARYEVVTRPGSGGPKRIGDLLVCRSSTLAADEVMTVDGITVTSPARTLVDLCAHLSARQRAKAVREGIRLRAFTALEIQLAAARHRGRRGTAGLGDVAAALQRLPIVRTRSDAEARALEVLDAAGLPPPSVNVRLAGEEADLSWPDQRRIVEIDGPQFHQDPAEDERKEHIWRSAGWTVQRISSDAPFEAPELLVSLVADHASVHAPTASGR